MRYLVHLSAQLWSCRSVLEKGCFKARTHKRPCVCFSAQTGNHLLVRSLTAFDPEQTPSQTSRIPFPNWSKITMRAYGSGGAGLFPTFVAGFDSLTFPRSGLY
jgi:hypothetical protein